MPYLSLFNVYLFNNLCNPNGFLNVLASIFQLMILVYDYFYLFRLLFIST